MLPQRHGSDKQFGVYGSKHTVYAYITCVNEVCLQAQKTLLQSHLKAPVPRYILVLRSNRAEGPYESEREAPVLRRCSLRSAARVLVLVTTCRAIAARLMLH